MCFTVNKEGSETRLTECWVFMVGVTGYVSMVEAPEQDKETS